MKIKITKLTLFVLILAMLIPNVAMAQGLSDLEGSMYKVEIERLVEEGIINGYTDGTFKPEANITRGEFAKILAVALKLELAPQRATNFKDVKGKWHEGHIGAIVNKGLMIGRSDTTFDPENNITREELAVVLVRAFGLEDIANNINIESNINDIDNVADWAKKSVVLATNIGLMNLTEESNMFLPKELGDRQITAKLTYELLLNKEVYDNAIKELKSTLELTEKGKVSNPEAPVEAPEVPNKPETPVETPEQPNPERVSEDEIVSKYHSKLRSLQSSVERQIDSLMSKAMSEIASGKSFDEVYDKYESLARDLESSTDSSVASIISSMEAELMENGYDTSAASDLYSEYESIKSGY